MNPRLAFLAAGCTAVGLAVQVGGIHTAGLTELAAGLLRPVRLPFQWRSLTAAQRAGDPAEVFAEAQNLLSMLPTWSDGHIVFAWRYALDGADQPLAPAAAATAALARLRIALAFLDSAAAGDADHRADLLMAMAFLVELAAEQQPGLAELLRAGSAAGDPAAIADRYRARAEAAGGTFEVRESRIFAVPRLAAAFLHAGERERALGLIEIARQRTREVLDRDLGDEWQATLQAVQRVLAGDTKEPRGPLLADPRLAPLHSFLR